MDIRELRYFIAVYEERSLTAASQRCHISQPSVSAALAAMEGDLGAKLFMRHRKGVTPTAAAETLYPRARRLVEEAAAVRGLFQATEPDETFTLGLLRSLDTARTTKLLAPVAGTPGIRLRLVGPDETADARIVEKRMATKAETFVRLWRERFVLALPARHPLAFAKPIHAADLRGIPFVSRCHCESSALTSGKGTQMRTVAVVDSEEWALALVAAGVGVTILPEGSVGPRPDIVVRPITSRNVSREIGIAYGGRASLTARGWDVIAKLKAGAARD